ncbi:MAG: hypothetical protein KIT24_12670 [Phycisphaeraceae bacterium]|nr:hypothetical protein [Phycisphaeraceae bacterium]
MSHEHAPTPPDRRLPIVSAFMDIRPGEWRALAWSAAYFFFVLLGYALLKPIRDELAVGKSDQAQVRLFTGTILAMLIANPIYTALVSWLPRRWFVPLTYQFFTLNLVLFAILWKEDAEQRTLAFDTAFYVWVSVYNLFITAIFWSVMTDLWTTSQSKRVFALIGMGGTLGFIVGSEVVKRFTRNELAEHNLPTWAFFLLSILCLQMIAVCLWRLARLSGLLNRPSARPSAVSAQVVEPGKRAFKALVLALTRPYLLAVSGYVILLTATNTVLWNQQNAILAAHFESTNARRAALATISQMQQGLTLFVQCFLSAWIIRRIGIGWTLAILPMVTLLGFAALASALHIGGSRDAQIVYTVFVTLLVVRHGLQHALSRPTREILFTGVSQEERYASKAFIDTFVYRAGDFAAINAIAEANRHLAPPADPPTGDPPPTSAFITLLLWCIPIAAAWMALSWYLGRWHRTHAREQTADHPEPKDSR